MDVGTSANVPRTTQNDAESLVAPQVKPSLATEEYKCNARVSGVPQVKCGGRILKKGVELFHFSSLGEKQQAAAHPHCVHHPTLVFILTLHLRAQVPHTALP